MQYFYAYGYDLQTKKRYLLHEGSECECSRVANRWTRAWLLHEKKPSVGLVHWNRVPISPINGHTQDECDAWLRGEPVWWSHNHPVERPSEYPETWDDDAQLDAENNLREHYQ